MKRVVSSNGLNIKFQIPIVSPTRYGVSSTRFNSAAQAFNHSAVTAGNFHFTAALYLLPSGDGQTKCVLPNVFLSTLVLRTKIS